jgi:broad specificity phosphatase PhoE
MKVYFVRHGQTQGNVEQYAQGPEEPLNEAGMKQAERVAGRCTHLDFETIVVSDMVRAQQTATAIATATKKPLETSQLFREVSMADVFNGVDQRERALEVNQEMPQQVENDEWFAQLGMESYRAVQARVRDAIAFLRSRSEERLLVVTHGTFLKFLIGEFLIGETATMEQLHAFRSRLQLSNTGISVVEFEAERGHWVVRQLNDISHFAE